MTRFAIDCKLLHVFICCIWLACFFSFCILASVRDMQKSASPTEFLTKHCPGCVLFSVIVCPWLNFGLAPLCGAIEGRLSHFASLRDLIFAPMYLVGKVTLWVDLQSRNQRRCLIMFVRNENGTRDPGSKAQNAIH